MNVKQKNINKIKKKENKKEKNGTDANKTIVGRKTSD